MSSLSGYHTRGYLPHLKVEGAAYFVTFRLGDSLPRELVVRLRDQKADLSRRQAEMNETRRAESPADAEEIDRLLDSAYGASWLRDPELAAAVSDTLGHFSGQRYELPAWVVMPNHVHAVVRPLGGHALERILHSWKSYTAHVAGKHCDLQGRPFWQRESYDHWIRDDAELAHYCHYTEDNPVKAGLCSRAEDWRWSSAYKRLEGSV